jgi:hypothetical protein
MVAKRFGAVESMPYKIELEKFIKNTGF